MSSKRERLKILRKLESGTLSDQERLTLLRSMEKPPSGIEDFSQQFVGSVAGGLEGLGNIGRPESFRGDETIKEKLGIEEPRTISGRAGQLAGETALVAPALGAAAATVPRAAVTAAPKIVKAGRILQNIAHEMGKTFVKSPAVSNLAEVALGASAGAGGFIAEKKFPDSDAAKFVGEIGGGLAPLTIVPAAKGIVKLTLKTANILPGVRFAIKGVKKAGASLTPRGGRKRAITRFERTDAVKEKALTSLSEELLPGFTPAQRSSDTGLLSLERDVIESSDGLLRRSDEQIASMNNLINESLKDFGGDPELTKQHFDMTRRHIEEVFDTRITIAAQRVDERVESLGANATREQANRIARDEIDKVVSAGVAQERELFGNIDKTLPMETTHAQAALNFHLDDLGVAEVGDIPAVAKRLLKEDSSTFLGDETTIKQMRSLQSKLRERARLARRNNLFNKARIADNIADAITEDFSNISDPEVSNVIETAVSFSRAFKERTRRGTIGKMLGLDKLNSPNVPAGLTLEGSLGIRGPKAREAFDDILKAFDSPEAPDTEVVREAAEDYIRILFLKRNTGKDGVFNAARARTFLVDNEELLNRMPHVKKQIDEAIKDNDVFSLMEAQKVRAQNTLKTSKLVLFIKKRPQDAFDEVLLSRHSDREMQKLIKFAERDKTGEALKGLKGSFIDYLSGRAKVRAADITDVPFVSGQHLDNYFKDPDIIKIKKRLFSPKEQKRLDIIVRSALRLDKARHAKRSKEGIIGDLPGKFTTFLAGTAGAAFGSQTAKKLGGGGIRIPNIMSRTFTKMLKDGVADPAKRLIKDAMQDEVLFREVLQGKMINGVVPDKVKRRLNAWVAAVYAEEGLIESEPTGEEEIEEERTPEPLPERLQRTIDEIKKQNTESQRPLNFNDLELSNRGRPLSTVTAGTR